MTIFSRQEAEPRYPTLANFLPEHQEAQGQRLQINATLIEILDAELMKRMHAKATYVRDAHGEHLILSVPYVGQTTSTPFHLFFDEEGQLESFENRNGRVLQLTQDEIFLLNTLWKQICSA